MEPFKIVVQEDKTYLNIVWFHLTVDVPKDSVSTIYNFPADEEIKEHFRGSLRELAARIHKLVPQGPVSMRSGGRYAFSMKKGAGFEWEPIIDGTIQAVIEFYGANASDVTIVKKMVEPVSTK